MRITFSGYCTVERLEELLQSVNKAVASADNQLVIELAQVVDADLAFFQLLHGTRRTLDSLGKKLVCADPLPSHLARKAALCGFSELGGQDRDNTCGQQVRTSQGGTA